MKGDCMLCGKEIEVKMCCSGKDCGCLGMPIDPPICDGCSGLKAVIAKYSNEEKAMIEKGKQHWTSMRVLQDGSVKSNIIKELIELVVEDVWVNAHNYFDKYQPDCTRCGDRGILQDKHGANFTCPCHL